MRWRKKHDCTNIIIKSLRLLVFSKIKTLITQLKYENNKVLLLKIFNYVGFQKCPVLISLDDCCSICASGNYNWTISEDEYENGHGYYLEYLFDYFDILNELSKFNKIINNTVDCVFKENIEIIIKDLQKIWNDYCKINKKDWNI